MVLGSSQFERILLHLTGGQRERNAGLFLSEHSVSSCIRSPSGYFLGAQIGICLPHLLSSALLVTTPPHECSYIISKVRTIATVEDKCVYLDKKASGRMSDRFEIQNDSTDQAAKSKKLGMVIKTGIQ